MSVVQAGIPRATLRRNPGIRDPRIVDNESEYRAGDICGIIPATSGRFSHPSWDNHSASEWFCTRLCQSGASDLCQERHVTKQFRVLRSVVEEFDKGGEFWVNPRLAEQDNCHGWTTDAGSVHGTTRVASASGFFSSTRSCHDAMRGLCCLVGKTDRLETSATQATSHPQAIASNTPNTAAPTGPDSVKGRKMTQSVIDNLLANLIAAPIVGFLTLILGIFIGIWRGNRRYRQKIDAAQEVFVRQMDGLIQRAVAEGENSCLVNAQAIVSARDSLRTTLGELSKYLNSDIDKLSLSISEFEPEKTSKPISENQRNAIWRSIQVLSRTWPSKGEQVKVEIRKLLAVLAITPE